MPGESYHTIHSTGDWTWLCDIFQKLVRLRLVRLRDWPLWNVFSPTATTVCTSDQITINWALDFVLNVLKSKLLHKYIVSCLKYGPVNHDLLWQVMSLDTCTNNFSDEVTEVSCLAWCWPLALYKIGRYFVLALDLGLPCVSVFFSSIVWCNIFQYVGCVDISFTFHGAFLSISLSVCWKLGRRIPKFYHFMHHLEMQMKLLFFFFFFKIKGKIRWLQKEKKKSNIYY